MAPLSLWVLAVTLVTSALAYKEYQTRIPNGDKVFRNGIPWPGVGHDAAAGDGPKNAFGVAFAGAGKLWTVELCMADSDEDGQSNGHELGDPNCTWSPGAEPARTTNISHPGFGDSMTSAKLPPPTNTSTSTYSPTTSDRPTTSKAPTSGAPRVRFQGMQVACAIFAITGWKYLTE
mmetsp:Transcript_51095/g.131855  ORF Transcript_51095/g.131855 Transcript_51095/m.131855 type:complete len:176 (+) Transcript_51095:3-530(+)